MAWVGCFAACVLVSHAQAASIAVDPITFTIEPNQGSEVLRVSNTDDKPVKVQVSPVSWSLVDGVQKEADSDALLLNPPIFSIEAHKTQFVRFGLRQRAPLEIEQSYRLIVEEVPDPNAPQVQGLRTVLRLSVPVFVAPTRPVKHVNWQFYSGADGMHLVVENDGTVHQRLIRISVVDDSGKASIVSPTATYVLPGERHEWPVPSEYAAAKTLKLVLINEQGVEEHAVASPQPGH